MAVTRMNVLIDIYNFVSNIVSGQLDKQSYPLFISSAITDNW